MRVLLRGSLDPYQGDTLGLIRALLKRGVELHLDPITVVPPIPAEAAVLLTMERFDSYDLILHLCEPDQLGLAELRRSDALKVAWTAADRTRPLPAGLDEKLLGYDLIIGYDTETIAQLYGRSKAATTTVHGGFWPKDWPVADREWETGHFGFTVIGEPTPEVLTAFCELRDSHPEDFDEVELNIKTDEKPTAKIITPGVTYYDGYWDSDTLADFYADQHVLIAAPKVKDNHALQFLSTGGTVIAARTSGSAQWLSSQIGYPVDWDDTDALKEQILTVVRDRAEAHRRGQRAADHIADLCGWDPVLDRLLTVIADAVPGRGERLLHTARVAQSRAKERRR